MKTVFVGAVEGSERALSALIRSGRAPDLVVTLPPDRAKRHSDFADLVPLARSSGSQLHFTDNINDPQTLAAIADREPDLALVIGWSQIVHAPFRAIPRLGTLGFHPAPLPQLRGRASIPWTILAGLTETAASLFWIDEGCDTGDIAAQAPIPVTTLETARSLYDKQVNALSQLLPKVLARIESGQIDRSPQDHTKASYCARRRPGDGLIDWTRPAEELDRLIRAVGDPYPGAFTHMDGHTVQIDAAHVFDGPPRYIGIPGQIQDRGPGWVRVSCGGFSCIEVTAWRNQTLTPLPRHAILGQNQRVSA
ncbi:Bifunctional polymyxin resistance protein ArnA [Rhodobacteraceae bacterium THAF1]|uniref:methionyl-tRNA formyltransferase n=1 Tax=Palleronia sp. THAF1 TaxID=2587842 RepID=UPI000F3BF57A|nr:formyltransferase family protein [Palleronia sp. THAF1]QFU10334.1 Bifunctional polymyxin resistance protein ArnA [Palleronia sp. THAF1]VDC31452.1 Bifunctional polymyxin resistance protein ArnA [Rhodobacteraceae bacterium THAF1]